MNSLKRFGKVLVIAAHADDETLGCGGIISKFKNESVKCHIHVATGYGDKTHPLFSTDEIENIRDEFRRALNHLGDPDFSFGNLPTVLINDIPRYKINNDIKNVIDSYKPNSIFIPSISDLHLDHKIINYSAKVACRPYLSNNFQIKGLYEYEVPSETNIYFDQISDYFLPNLYVDISGEFNNKLKAFSEYKSQLQNQNQPRSLEGLKALSSFRGKNIGSEYAEAFKIIFERI